MSQEYFVLFYFTFQAYVRILTAFLAIFFCYSYTRLKRYDKGLAIYLKYDLLSIPWYICSQNTWNLKSKNFGNIYWAWKKKYQSQLAFKLNLFTFEHQSECSPYCCLNITYGADKENLVGDQFLYSPNHNVWFWGDMVRIWYGMGDMVRLMRLFSVAIFVRIPWYTSFAQIFHLECIPSWRYRESPSLFFKYVPIRWIVYLCQIWERVCLLPPENSSSAVAFSNREWDRDAH